MKTRIVQSADVISCMRFDGSYHNAEVNIYDNVIKHHSSHALSYYCDEIFTSGRNKRVYTSKEFGYPFLSNSDVVAANPFLTCKYSSKKYGYDEKAVLKKGMILTGRVGAIGQTAIVPEYLEKEKAMGSDNIIRICVKPEYKNGLIYAYLASRIGNLSFWKHATGGVQPFITDAMVGRLPIPDFSESFQKEVDDLIQESTRLREEATFALEEAHRIIEKSFSSSSIQLCDSKNIKSVICDYMHRFDASYHLSKSFAYENEIKKGKYSKLIDLCDDIFGGGRAKRYYTDNKQKGVPFLSNTDLGKSNPLRSCKYSLRSRGFDEASVLKHGMIVTGRVGAIGQTQYIGKSYESMKVMGSDNVIRIVPKNNQGYIFAFLSSKIGESMFWKYATGGVQPFISSSMVGQILVPAFSQSIIDKCNSLIELYSEKRELSNIYEDRAVSWVEQEIEKWN